MNISCILLAAGRGERVKSRIPKALLNLAGRPLFTHSLMKFQKIRAIREIIIVVPAKYQDKFRHILNSYRTDKIYKVVKGGRERVDSVYNGLLNADSSDYILVHDSARPFVKIKLIRDILKSLKKYNAVIPALSPTSTLKRCRGGFVKKTLNRDDIYQIQTPQAFRSDILKAAFKHYKNKRRKVKEYIWDDSFLLELIKEKVKVIPGQRWNLKITYPEDMKLAECMAGI